MNYKLQYMDESIITSYQFLNSESECYFFSTYTAKQNYGYSDENQIISNLKISPTCENKNRLYYKTKTINSIANVFRNSLNFSDIDDYTFVPIPPSKTPNCPDYDDRIERILINSGMKNIVNYLATKESRIPMHLSENRISKDELKNTIEINNKVELPTNKIILVDDVITTGKSFSVCKELIKEVNQNIEVKGLFIMRTIRLEDEN